MLCWRGKCYAMVAQGLWLVWLGPTCLERGADCLHMVQLMPLHPKPHHLLPYLNPDWFYLSGTSLPRLS